MIENCKRTFPPKTDLREKQLLQDPGMSKMSEIHAACSVQNNVEDVEDIKTRTDLNRFLTDFLEFISFVSEMLKMCTNYNVDSDMKPSNYSKIRFKALIYFELQQSSN